MSLGDQLNKVASEMARNIGDISQTLTALYPPGVAGEEYTATDPGYGGDQFAPVEAGRERHREATFHIRLKGAHQPLPDGGWKFSDPRGHEWQVERVRLYPGGVGCAIFCIASDRFS